ncbi:Zinc finger, CCHC-type [Sesbania bispinosa]|nr:Zinc finger, CCHC-type [Sesbania bispinosa]
MESQSQIQNQNVHDSELIVELDSDPIQSNIMTRKSLVGKILTQETLNKGAVHGLPLDVMSTSNAAKIVQRFGEVIEVENPEVEGKLLRTFIRVRARVNVKEQLVTGCWVPRKSLPKVWVMLRYERLQSLCYQCGIIGHDKKSCRNNLVPFPLDPSMPKYSSKLGVPPARPILQLLKEQGSWKPPKHKGDGSGPKGQERKISAGLPQPKGWEIAGCLNRNP